MVFRIVSRLILSGCAILTGCFTAQGQQTYSIEGKILSKESPVVGASVFLHETRQGTTTGADGSFALNEVKEGTYTIYVSFVGYEEFLQRINVPLNSRLNVDLKESVHTLGEVVIQGDIFRQTQRESSVIVEKITAKEIAKNSGTTLMNSLERLPGISSINMGVGVSKPVIRGMSFNRIVVNDFGIKQEGQQWGSEHGLEIDQFNVENIEIIRGPASLAYGSDALGGVLNIQHPLMKINGKHEGDIKFLYRSNNGTVGATVSASGNHNNFVYKARATLLSYADYKVPATKFSYNRFVLPIYDKALKNTAGKEQHVSALVGLQKSWGFSHLTISNYNQDIGIFSGAMGIPRAYQLTPDGDSRNIDLPSQTVNHFKIISNNNIKVGNNWLEIDAGYQKNIRKEYSHPHAHGSGDTYHGSLALQLDLHTVTLNARHYWGHGRHQNILGFQSALQQNDASGYEFLIPGYNARQGGVFWLHKLALSERLIFNGGLRVDIASVEAKQVKYPFYYENNFIDTVERSPDLDRNFLNYSAAVGMAYEINTINSLKLNFGKTFRVPVASELTANGMHHGTFRYEVGDDQLRPEEGFQFDAAWLLKSRALNITLSPFYNYFRNYIYLSPSGIFPLIEIGEQLYPVAEAGQLYAFKQTEAIHTGGEAEVTWNVSKATSLSINGEYVWAQNLATNLPLPFTPPASIQFIADYSLPGWGAIQSLFLNLNAGYYFRQDRVERNEPATEAYPLVNISSGFGLGKKFEWLTFNLNVQNVLNQKYMNHLSRYRILNLPEPGRSFVISVRVMVQ